MAMEEVEIQNVGGPRGVASEATLLRLLDAAKEQNSNRTVAARTATRIQENYNKAQKEGTGLLGKAAQAAKGLADELVRGGDRVSDFTRHVLGSNSMFQRLIEFGDGAVDRFRSLSSVGASFNNSIFDMTTTAATAGMRLDEFYNVVQNNSEILRMLGGTVTGGAREFSNLSKNLRSGDLGRQLFNLGYTVSDINDGMLTYIENQALQGRLEGMTQRELIRGSREYLQEIDLLAKATGQSREALMQQTNELQNNAEFQALLSRAGEGADQLTNNMAAVAGFMPGFTSDLISIADGFQGSELAIALNQMGSSGQAFLNLLQQADSMSEQDFLRGLSDLGPDVANAITSQFDSTQMRLLRQQGSPIAAIFDALSGMRRMGNINVDQMIAEQEQRDQITSILAGFSDSLARIKSEVLDALLESAFADRVRDLSNSLGRFLTALFGGETPGGMISGAAGSAVSGFQALTDYLVGPDGILTRITSAFTTELDAFTAAINGGTPPMDYLRERAGELGTQLKNWFMEMFFGREINEGPEFYREGGLVDSIKAGMSSMFSFVLDGISNFWNDPANQESINRFFNDMTSFFQRLIESIRESVAGMLAPSTAEVSSGDFGTTGAASAASGEGSIGGAAINAITGFGQLDRDQFLREAEGGLINGLNAWIGDALGMGMNDWFDGHINDLMAGGVDKETAKTTIAEGLSRYISDNYSGDELSTMTRYLNDTLLPTLQSRRVGTLRATGRSFEPENMITTVNQGERVLNPSETSAINDLPTAISQLNTTMAQIKDLTMQSLSHQERTARGIRKLGGDIMGAV